MTLGFAFALSEICHLWPMAVNAMTSRLSRHENDALFRRAGFTQATVHQANGAKPRYRRRCGARDNRMAEFAIGDGFSTPRTEKSRILRVVTLDDGETIHNAFFDRNFR
jgi:hypothetical protein